MLTTLQLAEKIIHFDKVNRVVIPMDIIIKLTMLSTVFEKATRLRFLIWLYLFLMVKYKIRLLRVA